MGDTLSHAVPRLVREILFAPHCPPNVASLLEVATVFHHTGQYSVRRHGAHLLGERGRGRR